MKRIVLATGLVWSTAVACFGCAEPLKEAQLLEEPRVVGVRIESANGKSQVEPGEEMQIDFLLAGPLGPVHAEIAYRVCVGGTTERGVPECRELPFLEGSTQSTDLPLLAVLPSDVAPGERLVVHGVGCVDSDPSVEGEPLDWSCSDGRAPLRFSFETTAVSESEPNENPDLSELEITLSRTSVVLDEPRAEPSCDTAGASISTGEKYELSVNVGAPAFETGERLQVSLFSTVGHFERAFSFLDDGQTSFSLEFEAGSEDEAVKQYLVVRDSRGGVSWASWSLCQR